MPIISLGLSNDNFEAALLIRHLYTHKLTVAEWLGLYVSIQRQ
jgi:hypothetical protein